MLLSLIIILIFNIVIYRSFLNPIVLQSILWLIYYVVLSINIESFDIVIEDAYYFIIFQLIGFSLGGLICKLIYSRSSTKNNLSDSQEEKDRDHIFIKYNISLLYPVVVATLLVATYFILKESSLVSLLDVQDLRETLVEDDGKKYGTYGLIQLLMSVFMLIFISVAGSFSLKYKSLFIFFFIYTYLLGSRGQFIFFLVPLCYLLIWQKRVNFFRVLGGIIVIVSILFLVTYSRSNDLDSDFLIENLLVYTTASIPALVIQNTHSSEIFGYHTLRIIYLWLNKFGFVFPIAPTLSQWTKTPLFTNVYSYIKPYYYDFGLLGITIIPTILGFFYNLLYYNARKGSKSSLLMLSLFVYPLVLQVFDELYFRWATNWIYIYLIIKLITKIKIHGRWSSNSDLQS